LQAIEENRRFYCCAATGCFGALCSNAGVVIYKAPRGIAFSAPRTLWELIMSWTTPVIVEVCVGMEVTSYASATI
jgi:coenzyme PQQ precursor peptide PqqA